jgi:SAM-dependent methyltransferase
MSLRGRYVIDRLKRATGRWLRFPVPPYQMPSYWEGIYSSLGPADTFEWGNVSCSDLLRYEYQPARYDPFDPSKREASSAGGGPPRETTLGETLGVHPNGTVDEPILMLGCGNSRFGEDMMEAGWKGPMIQVDVSARVVDTMAHRCGGYLQTGVMQLVCDDATALERFNDETVAAAFDKGLVDALFCADAAGGECQDVLRAVHRVLLPGGVFCFLSLSRPEFILKSLLLQPSHNRGRSQKPMWDLWNEIQTRRTDFIYLYRFVKGARTQVAPRSKKQ